MGFEVSRRRATIYDSGTEPFTGTTMRGIAQAVAGILLHPEETANRFVRVRSLQTTQLELLDAFQGAVGGPGWAVEKVRSRDVLERGREKLRKGEKGAVLDLVVAQLFEEGAGRSVVVKKEESDNELLGVEEIDADELAREIVDAV